MKEVRSGFWVPAHTSWSWLFKGTKGSVPTYASEQINACLNASIGKQPGRGRTAIDGGAFVGSWSLHLAKHFERVLAFEPISTNRACLTKNLDGVSNVEVHELALSDSAVPMGRAYTDVKAHAHKVVKLPVHQGFAEFYGAPLDDLELQDVDLIKLDVEGHEYEALVGATQTILRCRPVVMIEEKFDATRRASRLLESLGMKCAWSKKHDYLFTWEKS